MAEHEKTLGDYLRMMQQAEKEDEKKESGSSYDELMNQILDDRDGPGDIEVTDPIADQDEKDQEQADKESEKESEEDETDKTVNEEIGDLDEDAIEEGIDGTIDEIMTNEDVWTSKKSFVTDTNTYLKLLSNESLAESSPFAECECESYLILSVTLNEGAIVVGKCYDAQNEMKNLLFFIKDSVQYIREL